MCSLMTTVKLLSASASSQGGDEALLIAQEHLMQYESQMSQLRQRLTEVGYTLFIPSAPLMFIFKRRLRALCGSKPTRGQSV